KAMAWGRSRTTSATRRSAGVSRLRAVSMRSADVMGEPWNRCYDGRVMRNGGNMDSAKRIGNRIGGSAADSGTTVDSTNPARPHEVVAVVPEGTAGDIDDAVKAAAEAQRRWARVPVPLRGDVIAKAGDVIASRKAELTNLVSTEVGKIVVEAGGDVQEAV